MSSKHCLIIRCIPRVWNFNSDFCSFYDMFKTRLEYYSNPFYMYHFLTSCNNIFVTWIRNLIKLCTLSFIFAEIYESTKIVISIHRIWYNSITSKVFLFLTYVSTYLDFTYHLPILLLRNCISSLCIKVIINS